MPVISIAMATYNGQKYLREQLDSILAQTWHDWELVICDDASTDGTAAIIQEYRRRHANIYLHVNEENIGFRRNFEKVIGLCAGDFIAFCDQDDVWEPDKIRREFEALGDRDLVFCNSFFIDEKGAPTGETMLGSMDVRYVPSDSADVFRCLVHHNIVQGATILARASFLRSCLPVPPEFEFYDHWFAMRACAGAGIAFVDDCLLGYRRHRRQVTFRGPGESRAPFFRMHGGDDFARRCEALVLRTRMLRSRCRVEDPALDMYVRETVLYYEHLRAYLRDFFTLYYVVKYYDCLYLDKSRARRLFRIAKRGVSIFVWRLFFSARRGRRARDVLSA